MAIVTILGIPSKNYGENQETELISQMTEHFNFDHKFFLLESAAHSELLKPCTYQKESAMILNWKML